MNIDQYYYDELLDLAQEELLSFSNWMNERYGNYPVIVGGWATFLHCRHIRSRDIDVVFPSREIRNRVLESYFIARNFILKGTFTKYFVKEVKTSKGTEEIIIDACAAQDRHPFELDKKVRIPWAVALRSEYIVLHTLENGSQIYIPIKELLLMFKSAALLGREYELKRSTADELIEYYTHKMLKDAYDISALIDHGADIKISEEISSEWGFKKYIQKAIEFVPQILKR